MEAYKEIMELLVSGLRNIYGNLLISIIVYGSVAHGTQKDDSDIDIALILKEGQTREMYDKMSDLIVDLQLEHDKVLSVIRIDYNEFIKWENIMPFYKNVKKDGIVLWKAA